MATSIGDIHGLERKPEAESIPAVPYASRGAGLYSEVSWDPVTSLRARVARTKANDRDSQPSATA